MGAPAKSTGERAKGRAKAASGRKTRGSARSKAEAKVESVPRSTRAQAIKARVPETPKRRRRTRPRHYDTTTSARPRILRAARAKATELGYAELKLSDITDAAEISHQGFYIHFKNKRHAVAVATSDQLGAVAELVNKSSKEDEAWAKRLEDEIDNALAETYPSEDGPESRLRTKLIQVIVDKSFARTRIEELVKTSGIRHGEFYRRYGGKKGCLQRIYGQALSELKEEIEVGPPLVALAEALAADQPRATLLLIGASYLPRGPEEEEGVATQQSFSALIEELVCVSAPALTASAPSMVPGMAIEVIRSSVIAGEVAALPGSLSELTSPRAIVDSSRIAA